MGNTTGEQTEEKDVREEGWSGFYTNCSKTKVPTSEVGVEIFVLNSELDLGP